MKFPAISGDDGKWYVPAQYEADLMAAIDSGTLIYLYNNSILEEYAIIWGYDGENPIKAFGSWNAEITEVAFGTPTEA